jgi:hypothetical protein
MLPFLASVGATTAASVFLVSGFVHARRPSELARVLETQGFRSHAARVFIGILAPMLELSLGFFGLAAILAFH